MIKLLDCLLSQSITERSLQHGSQNYMSALNVSKCGVFSGLYFPVFGLNTKKYAPEKTLYMENFHTVHLHDSPIYRSSSILIISTKKRTVFYRGNFARMNDLFHHAFRYLFAFSERKQVAFELIALASFHLVGLDSNLISKIETNQND